MSGGGQNTTSQQTVPDWLKPYYTQTLQQGQGLEQTGGPQYYPGQQVAPLSGMQTQGLGDISSAAGTPNASQGAQDANRFETSGALLNPSMNPYLQGTFKQAANQVQNQLGSEFATNGSNVLNSMPVQADQMNNLATSLYGGQYQNGLDQMTRAAGLAPSIDAGTYQPGQQLMNAGGMEQNQSQNEINAMMNRYQYQQQAPYNTLSWYSGLLGANGSPFAGQNSRQTMQNNPGTSALGGAAMGGALGSAYAGSEAGAWLGPWGMAGGAALGGLMGYFGSGG